MYFLGVTNCFFINLKRIVIFDLIDDAKLTNCIPTIFSKLLFKIIVNFELILISLFNKFVVNLSYVTLEWMSNIEFALYIIK